MMDFRGRYSLFKRARISHAAKIISTIMRKTNALVVMKGKNKELETKKGTKGMAKRPMSTTLFK